MFLRQTYTRNNPRDRLALAYTHVPLTNSAEDKQAAYRFNDRPIWSYRFGENPETMKTIIGLGSILPTFAEDE
ncbi:hypothetical protein Bca4012_036491 [Brassica carinata]